MLGLALALATLGLSGSAFADASNPTTTTVLTVSPAVVAVGSPVTMTATVTGVGGSPPGSVRFSNGSTVFAEVPLTPGSGSTATAVLVTSSLPAGTWAITANYVSTDFTNFSSSVSAPVQLIVSGATIFDTTTTLSVNPAKVGTGQPETLTAVVARIGDTGIPTGRVTFSDNGVSLGEAVIDSTGTATLTRSDFIAGPHSITADYSGDIADQSSSSAAVTLQVTGSSSAVQTTTTITATPNPIVAGHDMTISAHVVQTGAQTPPPGGTFVTFRTAGPHGAFLAQAPLDANGNASVTVGGWVPGQYVLEADYVGDVFDKASSGTVPVTVAPPGADLSLSATAPATVHTGGQITYSLVASNAGLQTAQNVVLTDPLPAGTTFVSVVPGGPSCGVVSGVLTCALGPIGAGASQTVTLVVAVAPGTAGTTITNTAHVTSDTPDPNTLADNTATATTQVRPSADLKVTATGTAAAVGGDPLAYSFTVANAGPEAAAGVVLTDVLPANLTVPSVTTGAGTCAIASGQLTCQLGTLAAGASVTVNLAGTLSTATSATSIANTASVSSSTDDPSAANNTATVTTAVTPLADLGITNVVTPASATPGGTLTYAITVSNLGPGGAHALLSFPLPADTTVSSATTTAGSCTPGTTVTCDLGTLAAGASATVTLTLLLSSSSSATTLTNTVTVSTVGAADRNPANNTATTTVPVLQVGCSSAGKVHANQDFSLVVGGKKRTVHLDVEGDCDGHGDQSGNGDQGGNHGDEGGNQNGDHHGGDQSGGNGSDKKTGNGFLHHSRLRVRIEGQSFVIDTNQDHNDGNQNGSVARVAITGPSDAVITGTWAGTPFTVTLHDGGAASKNDTVRVQYGGFDTGTLATKHGDVHIQNAGQNH